MVIMHDRPPTDRKEALLGVGRYLRLVDVDGWEFAERTRGSGVVAIVAVTDDHCLVLTEQYRPAVKADVIDLPAGMVGDADEFVGEHFQTAAARELEEETGFQAALWTRLVTVPTSPGLTSETVVLFLAEHLSRTGSGGGDAGESIRVHIVPLSDLPDWLQRRTDAGQLIDPKVYAGLWLRDANAKRKRD